MHEVILAPRAFKDLQDAPPEMRAAVDEALGRLASNPRPPGTRKLAGEAAGSYRIRVRNWRVLYDVEDAARRVVITKIGPRKSVYR